MFFTLFLFCYFYFQTEFLKLIEKRDTNLFHQLKQTNKQIHLALGYHEFYSTVINWGKVYQDLLQVSG
jgi:hypothetical protein